MTDGSNKSNTAWILILGGIAIAIITIGGFYLSQNPQIISDWQYKKDRARKDKMAERLLVAPEICASVETSIFTSACDKLELDDDDQIWTEGLTSEAQTCVLESFRDVTRYKLEYDGSPLSHLKNFENDSEIIVHTCMIKENLNFYRPDHASPDAASMINAWYQWKHSEGNYFN